VATADAVEHPGLSRLIADGLVQAEGLLVVAERFCVAPLSVGQRTETLVGLGLAEAVAEAAAQVEGTGEMSAGLTGVAEFGVGRSQDAGEGLSGGVVQAASGGQRRALSGGPFLVMPAHGQEVRHGPG
jgi:hypothetical protein